MISQLRGEVIEKSIDRAVIDVNGVGYEVIFSQPDIEELAGGQTAQVYTYFHVRENSHELFGFIDKGARSLFKLLITVNGVGPKSGMAVMALGGESEIRSAIAAGNTKYLTGASGIGKRAAEKIVLDLKEKVGVTAEAMASVSVPAGDQAFEALVALGYSSQQASEALALVPTGKVEDRVRMALRGITK